MSYQYLVGAEIDYTDGLEGAQFVIKTRMPPQIWWVRVIRSAPDRVRREIRNSPKRHHRCLFALISFYWLMPAMTIS